MQQRLNHDREAAEQTFAALSLGTDVLGGCAGLLWTAGWLSDEEIFTGDSLEWTILTDVIPRLESLLPPTGTAPEGIVRFYLDAARELGVTMRSWQDAVQDYLHSEDAPTGAPGATL